MTFSLPDHPLTQLIYKYQRATYNKLGPLVAKYAQKPPTLSAKDKAENSSADSNTQPNISSDNSAEAQSKASSQDENSAPNGNKAVEQAIEAQESNLDLSMAKTSSPNDSEYEEISSDEVTRLEVEALQRHLRNIVADVHAYLEQLISMFTVAYQPLGTASGKDICYSAIEEPFFKPIWGYLAALFR